MLTMEKRVLIAPIVLISTAMLMFEILQTIILSLQLFNQVAFMVVSLSMLGLGAGGTLATLLIKKGIKKSIKWLWGSALAFGVSSLLSVLISSRTNNLLELLLISLLPYIPVGLFLAFVFSFWPEKTNRNYCFNLVGSGLGCLLLMGVLNLMGDAGMTVLVISELGFISSLLLSISISQSRILVSTLLVIVTGFMFPFASRLFPFQPNPEKHYGQILNNPRIQSKIDWSRWGYLGRLDAVIPIAGIENFLYGKVIKDIVDNGCDFRFLFASGDNWAGTIDFRNNEAFKREFVNQSMQSTPYLVTSQPNVLNIGLGGGVDIFLALQLGARSVVGVEINPLMIQAVNEHYRMFFDDPFHDGRVIIKELDGRTFVNNTNQKFDVITLSAVDTGAGLTTGAYLLSENYLYTQEAFDKYFGLLTDNGFLFILRPQNQLLRSVVTSIASLRKLGVNYPERHFAIFGYDTWCCSLIGRSPLTYEQIECIVQFVRKSENGEQLYYLPVHEGNQFNRSKSLYFDKVFSYAEQHNESAFVESFFSDVSPVYDDSPYYYQQEKNIFRSGAIRLLFKIISCVFFVSFLLIVLPLFGQPFVERKVRLLATAGYFLAIAIGFIFIEIGLIQKLALFLGHPSYSISVTLFSILIFSGLGSIFSAGLSDRPKVSHCLIFVAIIIFVFYYAFVPENVLSLLYTEKLLLRCVIATVLLAPGSFFMGMPFPTMLRSLRDTKPGLIPWAYAINSFGSVIASVLAVFLAMIFGFSFLLFVGGGFYMLASFLYIYKASFGQTLPVA